MHHFTDGNLHSVWLANGYVPHQTPDGGAVSFPDLVGLVHCVCLALTAKPARLTGVELRYLRLSGAMMLQAGLAQMIGVDTQTVARWEKRGCALRVVKAMLRLMVTARMQGDTPLGAAIERVRAASGQTQLILRQTWGKWTAESRGKDAVAAEAALSC